MTSFNLTEENQTSNFPQELLISAKSYTAVAVILFFIGFFGFILNLSVIVFMVKEKQLWTPLNVILFNLVVGDFLVSVLGNPFTFLSAVNYKWIFGKTGCVLYGFIMALLGITSITTLTVLAFERYLIIAQPLRKNSFNFQRAKISVLIIWLYSLTLTLPPLFGWGEYVSEAADISCSVNWEAKSTNSMTYILYLFILGLFIPLILITFSYANIILKIKRNALRTGQVSKVESKVAYMIFIMIIAFLAAWSPYAILALIIQFGDASFITPGVAVFPALLAKSSICYNPIIYIGLNVQFQQKWKQVWQSDKRVNNLEVLGTSPIIAQGQVVTTSRNTKEKFNASGKVRKFDGDTETHVTLI